MKIGTCTAKKGKITKGYLTLAKYKGKDLKIPISIAKGSTPGKTIFISAGMHGDEVNGIEILHHFMSTLQPHKLQGTIIFLPLLNPWGFKEKSRYIPFDGRDLNRCFEKKGKSITYRLTRALMKEVIGKCDYGIDLHDGRTNVLLPHPRIFKKDKCDYLRELSYAFGTDIILEREGDAGMMAIESFLKHNTPVLTVEVGGAMTIRDDFRDQATRGLKNILIYTNLLNGVLDLPIRQFFLQQREGYTSPTDGILHIDVELGEAVKKGQIIARIHNPIDDKTFNLKSKNPGVVFSVRRESMVGKDQSVLSILHFKVEKGKRKIVPMQAKMLINKTKQDNVVVRPTLLIDNLLSLIGFSYKIVGDTIIRSLKKLEDYLTYKQRK